MNDLFEKRVRAAAVAGWWVVLIAVAFLVVQWLAYLAVMKGQPAWILSLWGTKPRLALRPDVWFWGVAILKLVVWLMTLGSLWLTLWARQLRKGA